jgi:hypothetical protein
MAVFVMVRSEKVAAWGLWGSGLPETNAWLTACAVDNRVFFIVTRELDGDTRQFLWKGNRDRLLDGSIMGSFFGQDGQEYLWRGFDVYAGLEISLVVDGRSDIGLYRVEKHDPVTALTEVTGQVRIMSRAQTLEGGFGFSPLVRTLPPEMQLQDGPSVGEMRRVVRAGIKVKESLGMKVDKAGRTTGRTMILNTDANADLGVAASLVSGNVEAYLLGWDDTGQVDIVQTSNAPMTVLSINAEVEFWQDIANIRYIGDARAAATRRQAKYNRAAAETYIEAGQEARRAADMKMYGAILKGASSIAMYGSMPSMGGSGAVPSAGMGPTGGGVYGP